jgi:hypothetical protein
MERGLKPPLAPPKPGLLASVCVECPNRGSVGLSLGLPKFGWLKVLKNSAPKTKPHAVLPGDCIMKYRFRFPQKSLHWGLFRVPNDGIISANSLGSDMLARRYPRGTAGRAVSVLPKRLARTLILALGTLGLNFAGHGCHSQKSTDSPSLEFTHIPPMAQGVRKRIDTIAGRVRNAHPRQQIVIYAHSGPWWVQPWPPYLGS